MQKKGNPLQKFGYIYKLKKERKMKKVFSIENVVEGTLKALAVACTGLLAFGIAFIVYKLATGTTGAVNIGV